MTNYILSRFSHFRFSKICFFAVLCFSLIDFAFANDIPADLEAYRAQVLEDTLSIGNILYSLDSDLRGIQSHASSLAGSSDQSTAARGQIILEAVSSALARSSSVQSEVTSINHVAASLVLPAQSNTLCNCGAQLDSIDTKLSTILSDCDWINQQLDKPYDGDGDTWFESIANLINENTAIWDIDFLQSDGRDTYYPLLVLQSLSSVSNALCLGTTRTNGLLVPRNVKYRTSNSGAWTTGYGVTSFYDWNKVRSLNLLTVLQEFAANNLALLASLNFSALTNESAFANISRTSGSIFNSVTNIEECSSIIEHRFSIFSDFVFSSDAPLSMYTDKETDGSYHNYLTNYYIKVSRGQQSGSDNYTNWFSRIEILLASLVFQDDGTNFVDDAENTTQMENTLSQSVDTLSQAVSLPQNVTGKIDNMGQSFLGLLGEWRTIVSCNSLPSQFVFCDINLGSQSRDSSGGSPVSSFRLVTSLDSGEFRQFLDFCHAVTTILFTMLFVWLSVMLLSFLLASLAKLAQFCYLVYSALFGG